MKPISSSALCSAKPEIACTKILSPEGLQAWWVGKVIIMELDPLWPAIGTSMSWKAGGGIFKAEIKKDARPTSVEMQVRTPSADSIISHTFEVQADGKTLYTKSVEPIWHSGFSKLLSGLFIPILRSMVKKEVIRAAAYADK